MDDELKRSQSSCSSLGLGHVKVWIHVHLATWSQNLLWLNGGVQLPCKREWLLFLARAELVAHGSSD